jgi:predicted RecB family endonuclease
MRHLEDKEQIALITWVRLMQTKYPELSTIYHCPNGGYRDPRTAAKFKAMGVKAGVWDIFLPCPTPGLFVEMKAGKGRLTPGQVSFRDSLISHGYSFVVAYSWHEAAQAIADHVGFTFDV